MHIASICPYCGSRDIVSVGNSGDFIERWPKREICKRCGRTLPSVTLADLLPETEEESSNDTRDWALQITRSGDLGGDMPHERYFQQATLTPAPGTYDLDDLDCFGFREGFHSFTICSVSATEIQIQVGAQTIVVTATEPQTVETSQRQISRDGPSWIATDSLTFCWLPASRVTQSTATDTVE